MGTFAVSNEVDGLVTKESYQVAGKVKPPYKEWLWKDNWLGDDPLDSFASELPEVKECVLPHHHDSVSGLVSAGRKLFEEGYDEIKTIADRPCTDKEIEMFALKSMIRISSLGFRDIKPDAVLEEKYERIVEQGGYVRPMKKGE